MSKIELSKRNSVTFFEIVVVIGVVMAIVGITYSSYLNNQKKERDVQRKSDLKVISQALDKYFDTCGYVFPQTVAAGDSIACPPPDNKIYLSAVPGDPLDSHSYKYIPIKDFKAYSLCSDSMEKESSTQFCITNH